MEKSDWPVVAADVRPARPDGTCFYCSVPLGEQHKKGCVTRTRTVVVDVTFRMVREVPEHWEQSTIEFALNESSSCADNLVAELEALTTEDRCLCANVTAQYVGEATEDDEQKYGISTRAWRESSEQER